MRIRGTWSLAVALVLAGWLGVAAGRGQASEMPDSPRQRNMERLLDDAINAYQAGRWVEAMACLDRIVAEDPTHVEAWALREIFGDRLLRDMALAIQNGRDLGRGPTILLSRAREHERLRLTSPARVRSVVDEIIRDPRNSRAAHEVGLLGAYTVPELLARTRFSLEDAQRLNAVFLLAQLGGQCVLPMTVALEGLNDQAEWQAEHNRFAMDLAEILGRVTPADVRALPALRRLATDSRREHLTRDAARRSVEAIVGRSLESGPLDVDNLYYSAARRLMLGGPDVAHEIELQQGLFFAWDATSRGGQGELRNRHLPPFIIANLYAQKMAMIGMGLPEAGSAEKFQALLARIWLAQAVEIEEYASLSGRQRVSHPSARSHDASIRAWLEYCESTRRKAWLVGPAVLADALAGALADGQLPVAVELLEAISRTAQWDQITSLGQGAMLAALDDPDARVRQRAAIALVNAGLPASHPRYADIIPELVAGAASRIAKVVLVISSNPEARREMAERLESVGVIAVTAASGHEGARFAREFPAKDAILLDSELEEFALLRQRLSAMQLVAGAPLPLVVVSSNARAPLVEEQFLDDPHWRLLPRRPNEHEGSTALYDSLVSANRLVDQDRRAVVVVTNDDLAGRRNLAFFLRLEAEKRANPAPQSGILALLDEQRLRHAVPDMRSQYSNIFLDDDLSGMGAMETLQRLRSDSMTRATPVALLSGAEGMNQVRVRFDEFLEEDFAQEARLTRLIDYHLPANGLLDEVEQMSMANPMINLDHQASWFNRHTVQAAVALSACEPAGMAFTAAQSDALRSALVNLSHPLPARQAIARTLGNWADTASIGTLASTWQSEELDGELRLISLQSLGEADREGLQHNIKLQALNHRDNVAFRDAAAEALAKERAAADSRRPMLTELWHTEPMAVVDSSLPEARDDIPPEDFDDDDDSSWEDDFGWDDGDDYY